ncbi:hypothetical protein FRC06_011591, partial [Ceratobasidium sp. 370]
MAPAPPPPPRILDSLKQVHFNRASWDRSTTAQAETTIPPPRLLSPARSRFASEDRIGEAQFYPGGSPTPRMSRHSEDYQRQYYTTERPYVDEPESYADPEPVVVVQPAKKKSKWRRIFSRKRKGKGKAGAPVEPVSPPPLSTRTDSYPEPPPVIPAAVPIAASDVSTSQRRFQLRDPGPVQTATAVPYAGSVSESRDASLRASEAARGAGSLFGYQQERPGASFVSQQVVDPDPPAVLIDPQTGNRIFREVSYVSNQTGSHRVSADGFPKKKKRSFGGTLKRLFTRKKKVPPLVIPPPEQAPPASRFTEVEDIHPLPPVPARTHSTPPSAVPV